MQQSPYARNKTQGLKPVGSFVPKLTKPAFQKFGFPAAALLTNWPAIAGPDIASISRPEKLKWPNGNPDFTPQEENFNQEKLKSHGAVLVLRVEGPRAIEIQFKAPQIIERINTYFGYRAVTQIRILQAPVASRTKDTRPPEIARAPFDESKLSGIKDSALKKALTRLGQGVKNRQER